MAENLPLFCRICRHHTSPGLLCAAYPDGIPQEILSGTVLHILPVSGDHGIRFMKATPHPSYFTTADPRGECLFRITASGSCERYVPILDIWEDDDAFIQDLIGEHLEFKEADLHEREAIIERARHQKEAINPCTLQFRQMMYLHCRKGL